MTAALSINLDKRWKFIQRLMLDCPFPQNKQFGLMLGCSLHNKPQHARRETASNDNKRMNIDQGFVLTVLYVNMRR